MEIALPRAGLPAAHAAEGDVLRLALETVDASAGGARVGSLATRGYPFNPETFAELLLPR